MINPKLNQQYRLIGVRQIDMKEIDEGTIIELISRSVDRWGYKVVSGKVNLHSLSFSEGCRLHSYMIPVGWNLVLPPDIKAGDHVVHSSSGATPWMVSEESLITYRSMTNHHTTDRLRFAHPTEVKGDEPKSRFQKDDIVTVTGNHVSGMPLGTIFKVNDVRFHNIYYERFVDENYLIHSEGYIGQDKLRPANMHEKAAFKEGFRYLDAWQSYMKREATKRFPSPASFITHGDNIYKNIEYDTARWSGDFLFLDSNPNTGCVYSIENGWARPYKEEAKTVEPSIILGEFYVCSVYGDGTRYLARVDVLMGPNKFRSNKWKTEKHNGWTTIDGVFQIIHHKAGHIDFDRYGVNPDNHTIKEEFKTLDNQPVFVGRWYIASDDRNDIQYLIRMDEIEGNKRFWSRKWKSMKPYFWNDGGIFTKIHREATYDDFSVYGVSPYNFECFTKEERDDRDMKKFPIHVLTEDKYNRIISEDKYMVKALSANPTKKAFSEEEFNRKPINQLFDLGRKKTRKQSIHNRINF